MRLRNCLSGRHGDGVSYPQKPEPDEWGRKRFNEAGTTFASPSAALSPPAFESCRGADAGAAVNRTVMVFACFNPP